ncbi:hypothetical protein [Halovulum sp. GXIMD14793]
MFLQATTGFRPLPRIAGLAVIALNGSMMVWVSGGLDGMMFAALVFAAYLLCELRVKTGRYGAWLTIILVLLSIARPEGMAIAPALALYAYIRRPAEARSKTDLLLAMLVLIAIAAQMVWRWSIYGAVVPNTYFAKTSTSRLSEIRDGLDYLQHWLFDFGGIIIAISALSVALKTTTLLRVLMLLGLLLIIVVEGGDPHPAARFFMPVIPIIAMDTTAVISSVRVFVRAIGLFLLVFYLPIQIAVVHSGSNHSSLIKGVGYSLDRIAAGHWPFRRFEDDPTIAMRANAVREIAALADPGEKIVGTDVGALAYFSDREIIDAAALNNRDLEHRPFNLQHTRQP